MCLERWEAAIDHFRAAARAGEDGYLTAILTAHAHLRNGDADGALRVLAHPEAEIRNRCESDWLADFAEQIRWERHKAGTDLDVSALMTSNLRNLEGCLLLAEGRTDEACAAFLRILKEEPKDFRALNNLGLTYWALGNIESARRCFEATLLLHPTWADALQNAREAAEESMARQPSAGPKPDLTVARALP